MTRIIKARDVKPGMEVEIVTRMRVGLNILRIGPQQEMRDDSGHVARVDADTPVTVLSEPAPPQPEEPTGFGARVVVDGRRFLRAPEGGDDYLAWLDSGEGVWCDWEDLCEMGPVQVVPDQGWTVPDTLEVPDRIEEWDTWEDVPEGVAVTSPDLFCHYRKNQGVVEVSYPKEDPDWAKFGVRYMSRRYGPWTRVTDA